MKKLFRVRSLVTCNAEHEVIDDAFLAMDSDRILELGPWKKRPRSFSKYLEDASHCLMMPGLFNLHTHLPMNLFRGIAEDVDLHTWLYEYIFPAEKKFVSPGFVRTGTELAACELIRAGITYVADMYYYPNEILNVLDRAGLRGTIAQAYFDQGGFDSGSLDESLDLARKLSKKLKTHPRLQAALGPHAPYTCSMETLKKSASLSKELGLPVCIHIAETKKELADIKRQTGFTPLRMVNESGLFQAAYVLSAHSIWLEDHDFSIMRDKKITAVINSHSNAKLGAGLARTRKFFANQVNACLGTDSAASNNRLDIFSEMNLLAKLYHLHESDMTSLTTSMIVDMATRNAAAAVGKLDELGSLEAGKSADFILLNLKKPHLVPFTNAYNHIVYSAQASDVESVYVAGKCLMKDYKLRTLKEDKIRRDSEQIWKKIHGYLSKCPKGQAS